MSDYKMQLDHALLLVQALIDEQYETHEAIQDAFNKLACELDEAYYKQEDPTA